MEDVKELLKQKYDLLTEVLSLCKNVKYGKTMEENILHYTEFYDNRQDIFVEIARIDSVIIEITGDKEKTRNEDIKGISKEIHDFDVNYRKNEAEFMNFLNGKIKEVNTSKKINNKFNNINYEAVSGFNVQG